MSLINNLLQRFRGSGKSSPNPNPIPPSSQSVRAPTTTVFNGSETGAYKRVSGEAYLPISTEVEDKFPLMPTWYFSAKLGQPRKVDIVEIRKFAESPWVRMAVNSILKQIFCTQRTIKLKDKDREPTDEEKEQMKEALEFLEHPGFLNESFESTWYPFMYDILTIDQPAMYKGRGEDGNIIILKPYDGSKFLVDMDWHGFIAGYYEYSFRYPISNPRFFSRDDIITEPFNINMEKYPYGFSPVQMVQQVIEVLIEATRWNKEFYKNNAIPNAVIKAYFKDTEQFKKFKSDWEENIKGQPNKTAIVNSEDIEVTPMITSNRDMEWLEGQKWYFHLVFGVFGLSPQEAGFYEDSNRATSESMERLSVRNAIRPYLKYLERVINKQILEDVGMYGSEVPFQFEFEMTDDTKEQLEHDQMMQKLQANVYTINEVRKIEGKETVEWGDKPFSMYQQEKSFEFYSQRVGLQEDKPIDRLDEKPQPKDEMPEVKKKFPQPKQDEHSRIKPYVDYKLWPEILSLELKKPEAFPHKVGTIDNINIEIVNRDAIMVQWNMDFIEGGHDLIYTFIPMNTVWIDGTAPEHEYKFNLLHELIERHLMAGGKGYDEAHEIANIFEREKRLEFKSFKKRPFTIDEAKILASNMNINLEVIDLEQLRMGIEIEQEHTNRIDEAAKIAVDHLKEIPDYYTRLLHMEEEAKKDVDLELNTIIDQSKDYEDFLKKAFKLWERRTLEAVDTEITELKAKSFNNFIVRIMNSINSLIFTKGLKFIIKRTFYNGINEAEEQLNMNFVPPENLNDLIDIEYDKQINGYNINGKHWVGLKGISIEVQKDIIDLVNYHVKKRSSVKKIKEEIINKMNELLGDEVNEGRALKIARTETVRLKSLGKVKAFADSGLEGYKIWKLGIGCNHCDECKSLEGQMIGINEQFYSSLTNKTHDHAPAHPNCCCDVSFKLKE
jgi:HK97 family phage portal protein